MGNAMTVPTSLSLTIDNTYVSTTIAAFGDTASGTITPLACGLRTCTSNNPNVIWDNATQLFTVKTLGALDVAGIIAVTLTCQLTSYLTVPASSSGFQLTIIVPGSCSTGNVMTVSTLPAVNINQFYTSTTIPAFGDTFSGATSPLTCGPRTCTSDNPNVIWDNAT